MSAITTTSIFWKIGNGNCYEGGAVGRFDTNVVGDGPMAWQAGVPIPAAAVEINEADYLAILAQVEASYDQAAIDAQATLDAARAELAALFAAAKAKLVAGDPLTEAEANALGAE